MSDFITISIADGVQTIRLDRPEKKNALSVAMYEALADAFDAGDRAEDVRVRLLLGAPGVFCAGNDIADFLAFSKNGGPGRPVLRFIEALVTGARPLVAAVDGPAVGIGTTLLMHCDLVYASPQAVFVTPFTDLGLVPEAASSLIAPRLMGPVRAFALLAAGEPFTPEQALQAGLINAVVPSEGLEAQALAAAGRLAAKPQQALRLSRCLLRGDPNEILARMREEAVLFAERLASAEARAAFAAFLARR